MEVKTTNRSRKKRPRGDTSSHPLLTALLREAQLRGDSLKDLARNLDVSYARLSQWRRDPTTFPKAQHSVFKLAAKYLRVPGVVALVKGGQIGLQDLTWPHKDPIEQRVERELKLLEENPFLGSFMPKSLRSAPADVKLFVVFLAREIRLSGQDTDKVSRWAQDLRSVAVNQWSQPRNTGGATLGEGNEDSLF
jgi:transcriptional regulator with XRE-family HTH domain